MKCNILFIYFFNLLKLILNICLFKLDYMYFMRKLLKRSWSDLALCLLRKLNIILLFTYFFILNPRLSSRYYWAAKDSSTSSFNPTEAGESSEVYGRSCSKYLVYSTAFHIHLSRYSNPGRSQTSRFNKSKIQFFVLRICLKKWRFRLIKQKWEINLCLSIYS